MSRKRVTPPPLHTHGTELKSCTILQWRSLRQEDSLLSDQWLDNRTIIDERYARIMFRIQKWSVNISMPPARRKRPQAAWQKLKYFLAYLSFECGKFHDYHISPKLGPAKLGNLPFSQILLYFSTLRVQKSAKNKNTKTPQIWQAISCQPLGV